MTTEDPKSRKVTVCSKCLTAACWHGIFMCDDSRTAGTVERTVAELDALGREHPSQYTTERVREMTGRAERLPRANETAHALLHHSITERVEEMRTAARRARLAYQRPGPLRDASQRLSVAYENAALVLEQELLTERIVEGHGPYTVGCALAEGDLVVVIDRKVCKLDPKPTFHTMPKLEVGS